MYWSFCLANKSLNQFLTALGRINASLIQCKRGDFCCSLHFFCGCYLSDAWKLRKGLLRKGHWCKTVQKSLQRCDHDSAKLTIFSQQFSLADLTSDRLVGIVCVCVCVCLCLCLCFCGEGVGGVWIGATFFFLSTEEEAHRYRMITQKHWYTQLQHTKKAYLQHWHTQIRHTKLQHSNQILSYIRLDNKTFLSATSMLSLWCTGCHCHTHFKILSNTHNIATALSGGWWAVMGHTHSGWYTMVHNTNWLCWLSAPVLSLGLYKHIKKNNNNKKKLLDKLCIMVEMMAVMERSEVRATEVKTWQ